MRKKNSPGVSIPPEYRWLERTSYMLDEIALKTEHKTVLIEEKEVRHQVK